jgi:hypothetical protein
MLDTLTMHRRPTDAGFDDQQAVAIIDSITGGVATKQDLDLLRSEMHETRAELKGEIKVVETKIDTLGNRRTLMFGVAILAVIGPALWRVLGP